MIAYSKHNVDFSAAKPVVSAAQKFVIPVAAFDDADPLVYPGGTEKAGQPITDWQGNPVGAKGLVFFNQTDQCYQAAPSDGRSVIIINEVTAEQALDLREFVRGLGERQPLQIFARAGRCACARGFGPRRHLQFDRRIHPLQDDAGACCQHREWSATLRMVQARRSRRLPSGFRRGAWLF